MKSHFRSAVSMLLCSLFVLAVPMPGLAHASKPAGHKQPPAHHSSAPIRVAQDEFKMAGAGPYRLTYTPDGAMELVYFDGMLSWKANFTIHGRSVYLRTNHFHPAWYSRLTVIYSY